MKRKAKSVISILLCLVMILQFMPALAEETTPEIVVNQTFNDIETNQIEVPGLTISGGSVKVVETSSSNKALYLKNAIMNTSVLAEGPVVEEGMDSVFSIDIKANKVPVNLTFGTANSATSGASSDTVFFKIVKNKIYTAEGKNIGYISGSGFTTVTVIVKKMMLFDYYINGRKVLSNWEPTKATVGAFVAARQTSGSACYIDNIRAYIGKKVRNLPEAQYSPKSVDILTMLDVDGDTTFFDNRYCHTSAAPTRYLRYTPVPKNGEIIATRLLNYQSPDRTDYIYMKRNDNSGDTYFQIKHQMPGISNEPNYIHRNIKMEGDLMAPTLQNINFLVRDEKSSTSSIDTYVQINEDGTISGGGKKSPVVVTQGKWFHFMWAINLDAMTFDVYVDGKKVISEGVVKQGTQQINMSRVNLCQSSVIGDLYIDNFDITGLKKPIVDGVETKTGVLPPDDNLIEFLEGKVAMHGYGNLIHKDGVKSELTSKNIYDSREQQLYSTADTLALAFDLNLTEENGEITGDITVKKDGTVTTKDGKTFKLEYTPKVENGRMYVPIRQFAKDAVGKYVWFFKTGLMIFSDYELNIDTSDFKYVGEDEADKWTPLHHLNAYMEYIRPDVERLKKDYIAKTGDTTFTKHPRIIHSEEEFLKFRKIYEDKSDPYLCQYFDAQIKAASTLDPTRDEMFANYSQWNDNMRHGMGSRLADMFVRLGYAYWITGDQKYVDCAFKQFQMLDKAPDVNTAHVLDAGHASRGAGIGYDWFYNAFTPAQREFALKVVREKCVEHVGNLLYGRVTSNSSGATEWRSIKIKNNYNAIVNAGITIAALATLEYDPDDHFGYIRESVKSIERCSQQFAPGGAWMEGGSYLNYMMQGYLPWACTMDEAFGGSYNIFEGQGMDGIIDFSVGLCGPDGSNQTGDGSKTNEYSFNFFYYLSQYFDNPVASYMRYSDLASGAASVTTNDVFGYDFNAKDIDPSIMDTMPKMQRVDGMEFVTFRDTYTEKDCQLFFSTHFGASSGYHQHWDCGTFVVDFDGKRWAHDLGSDSYLLQNELGYPGYAIFRKRTEAHNMLTLNPSAYSEDFEIARNNYAPIIDAQSNQYGGFVYADMSEIYAESPDMKLGYYLDDNMTSVTVRYEYFLPEAVDGVWGIITSGSAEIDGNTVFLADGGKSIKLEALTNAKNVRWEDNGNPKPLPTSPQCPEQNKNEGFRQLHLKFDGVQGDNKLVIKITQLGKPAKPIADIPISEWKLPTETKFEDVPNTNFKVLFNGVPVASVLPVYDGEMPKIEIITEDPTSIVEVEYAKTPSEKTKIRVYDKDRKTYQLGLVEYYAAKGMTMAGFDTLQIVSVEVTSQPESANVKDNMLDGDLLSRWTTMARGEYALFDLGKVQEIDGIGAGFYKGDARVYFFNVFVSEDGEKWTQVIKDGASSGQTNDVEAHKFKKRVKARYIKLEGQGNNGGAPSDVNFNVTEFVAIKSKY